MADHERGEVVAWQIIYRRTELDGSPSASVVFAHNAIGDYRDLDPDAKSIPLVRQSDYLEAVADLNTVRALVEQQNAALTEAADEIERLRAENAANRTVADEAELNREGIKAAHADLRKLRARIEAASVGEVFSYRCVEDGGYLRAVVDAPTDLIGKRVRLVVDEKVEESRGS